MCFTGKFRARFHQRLISESQRKRICISWGIISMQNTAECNCTYIFTQVILVYSERSLRFACTNVYMHAMIVDTMLKPQADKMRARRLILLTLARASVLRLPLLLPRPGAF